MLTLLLTILWLFSILSAGHALLNKRDPRAALGWIVTCLAIPGIGAIFYWLLSLRHYW
jgi:cardiolipin synthase